MEEEKELVIPDGSLYYTVSENGVLVTRFQGTAARVTVPAAIEGRPVRGLFKKAFLSRKDLRRVTLPDTLEEVGDWAFAYCSGLVQVTLPKKQIRFGKSVFLECGSLQQIPLISAPPSEGSPRSFGESAPGFGAGKDNGESAPGFGTGKDSGECVPELLAAAVRVFDAYYLLDPLQAGSGEWLEKWDARLTAFLHTPDQEGYSRQVLCGEEDYGSTDLGAYVREKRKGKVRLAFLRLLFSLGLKEPLRKELEEYLVSHTRGEESQETWLVLLEEHGDDRAYYSLFARLGCLRPDNLGDILADIGEGHPEMKAYFLKCQGGGSGPEDFFEGLSLDD